MEPPWIDHVSLAADRSRVEALGFALTPTPDATDHARVHLDRTYLEVTPPAPARGLAAVGWFLRVQDVERAAERLREAGVGARGPTRYEGVDGSWLDLALADDDNAARPILSKRLDLPAEAWPPAARQRHRNGATRLSGLRILVGDAAPLAKALLALGARRRGDALFDIGGGGSIVLEPAREAPEGIAALRFDRGLLVDQNPLAEGGDVGRRQPAGGENGFEIVFE